MSTEHNALAGTYLVQGTIGNVGVAGAPIVYFALVVTPGTHQVTGTIEIKQAVQNGNYTGRVTGTLYATGFGPVTQVVGLTGSIYPDGPMPLVLPFDAHLAINAEWHGSGGFNYAGAHVENAPVNRLVK